MDTWVPFYDGEDLDEAVENGVAAYDLLPPSAREMLPDVIAEWFEKMKARRATAREAEVYRLQDLEWCRQYWRDQAALRDKT